MSSSSFFYWLGDASQEVLSLVYDNVGNLLNYTFISLISFGLIYWLFMQKKLNKQAEENPDQRK